MMEASETKDLWLIVLKNFFMDSLSNLLAILQTNQAHAKPVAIIPYSKLSEMFLIALQSENLINTYTVQYMSANQRYKKDISFMVKMENAFITPNIRQKLPQNMRCSIISRLLALRHKHGFSRQQSRHHVSACLPLAGEREAEMLAYTSCNGVSGSKADISASRLKASASFTRLGEDDKARRAFINSVDAALIQRRQKTTQKKKQKLPSSLLCPRWKKKRLVVFLRYEKAIPALYKFIRVSKPGRRIYCTHEFLKKNAQTFQTLFLSTAYGILSHRKALTLGVGGELLCKILF